MRRLDREHRRAVGLDVVRVTVSAVTVIGDYNVGTEATDLGDDLADRLIHGSHPEGVGELVGVGAGHSRVAVAQELDVIDLENPARLAQLGLANLAQVRAGRLFGHVRVDDGRQLPVGAAHDAGFHAAVGVCGERAAHRDGLVVAVRMHCHQTKLGVRHHSSVMVTDFITSSLRIEVTTSMPLVT